jgi:predicted 2-oxoglutarate/Fe(II)-dependent dioxygenase YbiX
MIELIQEVLSKRECEELIDYHLNVELAPKDLTYNALSRTKVVDHILVKRIAREYSIDYNKAFLMRYETNTGSSLHYDNYSIENSKEVFYTWKKSAVIFLNDEFDGGELVYPKQGLTIKPVAGNMVIAPADDSTPHYVNPATNLRYVLVIRIN